ncbi:MAG TPA: sodium-dependent transporter [Thermoplasmatales archaeon]|nr:sodium-dependent transporter [Thermoplasmatales archaeon]
MYHDLFMAERPERWGSRMGFILATIGSAIGVSNVWRFSYLAYKNGGGAFLLPYAIALLTVGIPLLIVEQSLGHEMRGSAPAVFRKIKQKFEVFGWWPVVILVFGLNLYYAVILSDCINYFALSATLGWGDDPNAYFFHDFLHASHDPWVIGLPVLAIVLGLLIIWVLNWVIIRSGLRGGVERVCKILIPLLMVLASILVIRGVTLPGSWEGIRWYVTPHFDALFNPLVWIDAFSQVFFSLSLGMGVIMAYSKYLPKKSNLFGNALIVGFADTFFSVFIGIAVFGILGNMMHTTGLPMEEVVEGGIGLAFVVFPQAFNTLPLLPQIVAALFFLTLIAAGLSSLISMIVAFLSGIIDKFKVNQGKWINLLCIIGFLGGIIFTTESGIMWLDIVDHFLLGYGLVLMGLLEIVIITWVYGEHRIVQHVNAMSAHRLGATFSRLIKYVTPGMLGVVLLFSVYNEIVIPYGGYSRSATMVIGFGWLLATLLIAIGLSRLKWRTDDSPQDS